MSKILVAMLAFASVGSGCAAMRAAQARNRSIQSQVEGHTYQRTCNEIWSAARMMLFSRDYQVKSADAAAGLTLETDWKYDTRGGASRYLFQGNQPNAGTCQVMATQANKSDRGSTSMHRDWTVEWDLLKQVDIEAAQRIEAVAEQAAEKARNEG